MSEDSLTPQEKQTLLRLARQALELGVRGDPLPELDPEGLSSRLLEPGATFVTLTKSGRLRGCIGTLEPRFPLAEDVRKHAIAAALNDYRFPPVRLDELSEIEVEISRLTHPQQLVYEQPEDLISHLRPGIDGVVLRDGFQKATFLPQVWEKLPDPEKFMSHLCRKMGADSDLWRSQVLEVEIYQVEEFHE